MSLENEFNKIFRAQNEFNKRVDKFQIIKKNNLVQQFMLDFDKKNNILKIFDNNSGIPKILKQQSEWNKKINKSFEPKYQLPNVLINIEKNNELILKILNKNDFIDKFINEMRDNLEKNPTPHQSNINIFKQMISHEFENLPASYQHQTQVDLKKLTNQLIYALFFIFWFYIQNTDHFTDVKEAFIYYINNIECNGVTISRVNLRTTPNFLSETIITIPKNSVLKVYNESSNGWVKVRVNLNNIDVEGYVSEAYIRKLE
ncbi:SH3 domain-containing protein [Acinetobacter haemolyticus]|uniref:SH3 domain-containing protein n=1 Tax=Acinetobacter haemolyticus TaxID=29430 RepID=UPI003C1BF806